MKLYFAPMEGITGYVYRNAHRKHFQQVDQYFTPFVTPNQTKKLTPRELHDVMPEHNEGISTVPQILTNKAEDFCWGAERMREYGYREVNLNLGCPSGTVVSKQRGSGFLARPVALDRFLDTVTRELESMGLELSIKTRIGKDDPEEFEDLLRIFNRYPLKKLIIHPRIQTDYYKNHPNLEVFRYAVEESANPVCYNGDLFSVQDVQVFLKEFPRVEELMLGRGALTNPAIFEQIRDYTADTPVRLDRKRLQAFHDEVLAGYREAIPGDKNVMFKMKELWFYLGEAFADSKKYTKKIKKAQSMADYQAAVDHLFSACELAGSPVFRAPVKSS